MDRVKLETLLQEVKVGRVSVADAVGQLQAAPVLDLGFANIDQQRPPTLRLPRGHLLRG